MAIDATAENSKRRNVEPLSAVTDIRTLSADCSGFANTPLDGEFVFFRGNGKAALSAADLTSLGNTTTAFTTAPGDELKSVPGSTAACWGGTLRMIWSEDRRSDRASLGDKRVPVLFLTDMHCKLHLYNYDASDLPRAGDPIFVRANKVASAAAGSDLERLVATVYAAGVAPATGSGTVDWIVGTVLKDVAAAGDPMECVIFANPRPILNA